MFICVVNDTKNIQNFLVRAWLFVHLNDLYVLNESYENDTSLGTITPNQAFWKLIYMIPRFLFSDNIVTSKYKL